MQEYVESLKSFFNGKRNYTKTMFKISGTIYRGVTNNRFTLNRLGVLIMEIKFENYRNMEVLNQTPKIIYIECDYINAPNEWSKNFGFINRCENITYLIFCADRPESLKETYKNSMVKNILEPKQYEIIKKDSINQTELKISEPQEPITPEEWEKLSSEYKKAWCNGSLTQKLYEELKNLRLKEGVQND